ncbi:uncharacterized protein LOC116767660 [Danaus plexippus]|uniref:uncharacterized protein LOC116767660 n=1 Tax=Danaus plexippus TaxID=13037 RepID=UPI002AB1A6F7|nr:uncharacterized protein LOC116767660 [Danaus plexippus]
MSNYLWGIAQLVNDPSSEILTAIQKRIFNKNKQNIEDNENETNIKSHPVNIPNVVPCEIKEPVRIKTKCIQIGRPLMKHAHCAVQTKRPSIERVSKATSVQTIVNPKQSIGILHTASIKDTSTKPVKKKLCDQHRDVFIKLQDWSCPPKNSNEPKEKSFSYIKRQIKKIVNLMKIEKIRFPEVHGAEEQTMELYRRASQKIY